MKELFRIDVGVVRLIFAAVLCFGAGVAGTSLRMADAGDTLSFAGGLIGAGAAVLGAFAVVEWSGRQQQREARNLFSMIATGVRDDMIFLERLQRDDADSADFRALARRIDGISDGIPQTARFFQDERLGAKSGSIAVLAAELRFRAALEVATPAFERMAAQRRDWRNRMEDEEHLSIPIRPAELKAVREAAQAALTSI
jgi:hypothetical protein